MPQAPESAKNTVKLLNDGWVIDVRDAASADKMPTTRKRDIKIQIKLTEMNLDRPMRFVLKAVPLLDDTN